MEDKVFMIIPEPHIWDKNISTRIDYVGEIKEYMTKIKALAETISNQVPSLNIIFMGDIFHKGMKDAKEILYWYQYFLSLNSICENVYSVIGNHELSYRKDNLFWHLCNNTSNTSVEGINALGEFPLIQLVDTIDLASVQIHLNHHGVLATPQQDGKTHIGLFHQSIIDTEIAKILTKKYNRDPLINYIDHTYIKNRKPFTNYDYAFIGHMHKAFGLFTVEDENTGHLTRLRYLASIGRTNKDEVLDSDLTRVIPIIKVRESSKDIELKEVNLVLRSYEQTINEVKVEENKEAYENQKDRRELKKTQVSSSSPVNDLKLTFLNIPFILDYIDSAVRGEEPYDLAALKDKVNTKINWEEYKL